MLVQQFAALRALHGQVVQGVGGVADVYVEVAGGGLLLQPQAGGVFAADEAEDVAAHAKHGAVVHHAAVGVAHGGVDDLADGELAQVAGLHLLQQGLGVGAGDIELAQGRQVHDRHLLAAGPVFGQGAVADEAPGQPEALVVDEVAGEGFGDGGEGRRAGQAGGGVGRHAVGHRAGEGVVGGVDARLDVGGLPGVGGVDVVGAGRHRHHQILHGAQQHVVAGLRPGFGKTQAAAGLDEGVVEEVDGRPAHPRADAKALQRRVEVVAAVGVAGKAQVVVILAGAGQGEGVVAADGVLHGFEQGLHAGVEVLGVQAGLGVGGAGQGAGHGGVEAPLVTGLQGRGVEGQQVGTLPPVHVDDLDELPGLHREGPGRGGGHADHRQRLGEDLGAGSGRFGGEQEGVALRLDGVGCGGRGPGRIAFTRGSPFPSAGGSRRRRTPAARRPGSASGAPRPRR
jgi:hypothetical protein